MTDFDKVVRLGTVQTPHNSRWVSVFAAIDYKDGRLSITGVVGPRSNGNAYGGAGQIVMEFQTAAQRDAIKLADGWSRAALDHFFDVWDRWHLNDMQAGSPAQTAILGTHEFPGYPVSHYDWARELLAREGFNPDPSYLHDGEPYRYGSAWLSVPVPQEVLNFLSSLPDTDRTPAWV